MEIMINGMLGDKPIEFSGSRMEYGENAGKITWANSMNAAYVLGYAADENREEVIDYFLGYGAWEEEELTGFTNQELTAMIVQEVASSMREFSDDPIEEWDWEEYEHACERGEISGNLFQDENGDYYISLSH